MKHLFQTVFCGALLLVALVFVGGTASAHTMPDSEWGLLRSAKEFLGTCIVVVTHRVPSSLRVSYRHLTIENGRIHEIL